MTTNTKTIGIILFFVCSFGAMICIGLVPAFEGDKTFDHVTAAIPSANHPKIFIGNDAALIAFPNKTGGGTRINPYVIKDLVIDGGGSGSCIHIVSTTLPLEIRNCTVTNSGSSAGDAGITVGSCYNMTVINCTAVTNTGDGISCMGHEIRLINNSIQDNGVFGIRLSLSTSTIISGNHVFENVDDGVYLGNVPNVTITDNAIHDNDQAGIAGSGTNITIANNIVYNNTGDGILLGGQPMGSFNDGFITGNNVTGNGASGLVLRNSNYTLVS
nr:right-handed parallel beta-helix repeat-containing protein [Candidatus Sigynarchaeota archaeon]